MRGSRSRRWSIGAAAVLLGWSLATVPATAGPATGPAPDWVSIRLTERTKDSSVPFTATASFKGQEPRSISYVVSTEYYENGAYRFGRLFLGGGGVGTTVRTSGPTYAVTATRSGPGTLRLSGWTTAFAGRRAGLLVLAPGGRVAVEVHPPSTVTVGRLQGTGAQLLRIGQGIAGAGGADLAAGATAAAATVPSGVVGTFGFLCAACYDDWVPPGGHSHRQLHYLLDASTFAGQAGRWSWTWVGLGIGEGPLGEGLLRSNPDPVGPDGIIGAYAPVPDWENYRATGD